MKVAVTGAGGNLGRELIKRGCIPINCNILYPNDFVGTINAINPDILIHCAAKTDIAYCESHFREAFDVNVKGTANVLSSIPNHVVMIYMSTDHVFSGGNWFNTGYGETHRPNPVNYYGYTKWGGELVMETRDCRGIIIRTSRCFNYPIMKPTIDALKRGEEVELTNLIKRSFMYLPYLADGIVWLCHNLDKFNENILHIAGESIYSYAVFWEIVRQHLGLPGAILPRNKEIEEAPRPFKAGLDIRKAKKLGVPIGSLKDALNIIKEEMENDNA